MKEKQAIASELGLSHAPMLMRMYVEDEVMGPISTALQNHSPCRQFSVLCDNNRMYKIDMFFPLHRLAVECDEHDHRDYNQEQEEDRMLAITRKTGCKWLRFDPHQETFCVFVCIREILVSLTNQVEHLRIL